MNDTGRGRSAAPSTGDQRIFRAPRRQRFTVVDNSTIEDPQLSLRALGLLVYVLSKPDHWRINRDQLAASHADGVASVRAGLAELAAAGYVRRVRANDPETGRLTWVTYISEHPDDQWLETGQWSEQGGLGGAPGGASGGSAAGGPPAGGVPAGGDPAVLVRTDEVTTEEASTEEEEIVDDDLRPPSLPPELWVKLPKVVRTSEHANAAWNLCVALADSLEERQPRRPTIGQGWMVDMEALLRLDQRDPESVARVLRWLHKASDKVAGFWRTNVRSPGALRSHWDRMQEQYVELREAQRRARPGSAAALVASWDDDTSASLTGGAASDAIDAWSPSTSTPRNAIVVAGDDR